MHIFTKNNNNELMSHWMYFYTIKLLKESLVSRLWFSVFLFSFIVYVRFLDNDASTLLLYTQIQYCFLYLIFNFYLTIKFILNIEIFFIWMLSNYSNSNEWWRILQLLTTFMATIYIESKLNVNIFWLVMTDVNLNDFNTSVSEMIVIISIESLYIKASVIQF